MTAKVYVGNLLYECTDADLEGLFSRYGQVVSAEIVRYRKSRRSKGFGYVRFADPAQAQAAIDALNGHDFMGRRLMLAPARSEDPPAEVQQELRRQREELRNNPPAQRDPRMDRGGSVVSQDRSGSFARQDSKTDGWTPLPSKGQEVSTVLNSTRWTFRPEPYDHELPAGGEHLIGQPEDAISQGAGQEALESVPAAGSTLKPVSESALEQTVFQASPNGAAVDSAPLSEQDGRASAPHAETTVNEATSPSVPGEQPTAAADQAEPPRAERKSSIQDAMRAFGTIFSGGRNDKKDKE